MCVCGVVRFKAELNGADGGNRGWFALAGP